MRVLAHWANLDGCARYRLQVPIEQLRQRGHDVQVMGWYKYQAVKAMGGDGKEHVVGVQGSIPADVVVLQRPLRREMFELMIALQDRGIAVVVEVDDNFHALPASNPVFDSTHPARDADKNRDWLRACTDIADWVTVSTPALKEEYGGNGRCTVLPNYMPDYYLDLPKEHAAEAQLGWSGSLASHRGDLRATKGAVERVLQVTGGNFHVVGQAAGVAEELGLSSPASETGFVELEHWVQTMAQIDVHIVPLKLTKFTASKSFLKGLQAVSLGIPFVASPTEQYLELEDNGIGTTAATADEWYEKLMPLMTSFDRRVRVGQEAKERVREDYVMSKHAHEWWAAWECAYAYRSAQSNTPISFEHA